MIVHRCVNFTSGRSSLCLACVRGTQLQEAVGVSVIRVNRGWERLVYLQGTFSLVFWIEVV